LCFNHVSQLRREVQNREVRNNATTSHCLDWLGLEGGTTVETIKAAYRRPAKERHPDHGGNVEEFKRLQEAYEMAMSSAS
jgi:DnaJ-class molecular chaperone